MKLWVDDVRPAPPGWVWVQAAKGAKIVLANCKVEEISLDHDMPNDMMHRMATRLGGCPIDWGECDCETGYNVACFIEKRAHEGIKPPKWRVHSSNPSGAYRMRQALTAADKAWVRAMSDN